MRSHEDVERLIAALDPDRDYGELSHEQVVEAIYSGDVIIEASRSADFPVLTTRAGRLILGSGQREGVLSPKGLARLSWGYPRGYVDRRERPPDWREIKRFLGRP